MDVTLTAEGKNVKCHKVVINDHGDDLDDDVVVMVDNNDCHRLSSPLAVPTSSSYSLRTRVRLFDNSNELLTLDQGNSN